MEPRIDVANVAPGAYKAMVGLDVYLRHCGLEESLLPPDQVADLANQRLRLLPRLHWKDLKAIGESEQRLYSLDARRETPFYSDRERAALAWTEAVTRITEGHVPDEVFEQVRARFSEKRSLI